MKKKLVKYSFFFSMLFLQEVILASSLHLEFGPSVNTIFFSDKLIQDYYMRSNTVSYGGDIFLKSDVNNLFGFAKYRQYSFNIDDSIQEKTLKVNSDSYIVGFGYLFSYNNVNPYLSIGLVIVYDDLQSPAHFGFQPSIGLNRRLSEHMQINLELGYEYSKITVEEYEVDTEYTRHNAFLSGAQFQSGGIIATLNIVYSINM